MVTLLCCFWDWQRSLFSAARERIGFWEGAVSSWMLGRIIMSTSLGSPEPSWHKCSPAVEWAVNSVWNSKENRDLCQMGRDYKNNIIQKSSLIQTTPSPGSCSTSSSASWSGVILSCLLRAHLLLLIILIYVSYFKLEFQMLCCCRGRPLAFARPGLAIPGYKHRLCSPEAEGMAPTLFSLQIRAEQRHWVLLSVIIL